MSKPILNPAVKFAHFKDENFTLGYHLNDIEKKLTYSTAQTHPNDTYNHRIARSIVHGRIVKGGINVHGNSRNHEISYHTINLLLDGAEFNHKNIVNILLDYHNAISK